MEVRIQSGSINLEYLKNVKREKFDKDFSHITQEERNEAWNKTHQNDEPVPVPPSNKGSKKQPAKHH